MQLVWTSLKPGCMLTKAYTDDAGYDLPIWLETDRITLLPNVRFLADTGVSVQLPYLTVGLICARSGLAYSKGLTVLNAPGVVDTGYRGEVKVLLYNASPKPVVINHLDRVAQLLIVRLAPLIQCVLSEEPTGSVAQEANRS